MAAEDIITSNSVALLLGDREECPRITELLEPKNVNLASGLENLSQDRLAL